MASGARMAAEYRQQAMSVRIGCGLSTDAGPPGRRDRGRRAAPARARRPRRRPRGRLRRRRAPRRARGDARGRPRGARARRARRLRRGRRRRRRARDRGAAPPSPCGRRRSDGGVAERLPRRGGRGRRRRRGRRRARPATAPTGASCCPTPTRFPTDAVLAELADRAPGVPVLGGLVERAHAPPARRRCSSASEVVAGRRGRRALRRRRGAAVRLAGRRAGRPRADRHRRRGQRHPRARRAARRSSALRDGDRGLGRARARDPRRAGCCSGIVVDGGKPDVPPRRLPRARRCSAATPRRGRRRRRPGRAGQVVRLHARDAASADRDLREALGAAPSRRSAATRPPARWCSPATAAGAGCSACPTTTPTRWPTSWRARRRPASSRPARSGRSAARPSCTASPPPWQYSRRERLPGAPPC